MNNTFQLIIWMFILSGSFVTFIGARAAWRMRNVKTKQRSELAVAFAIGLNIISVSFAVILINSIINSNRAPQSTTFYIISLISWFTLVLGFWIISMTLMNGQPGFIRRALSRLLQKWS